MQHAGPFKKEHNYQTLIAALASRSATIAAIVEANNAIKAVYCRTSIARPSELHCHKLDMLVTLLHEVQVLYSK